MTPDQLPAHIREKVSVQTSGCWLWTAATNAKGYGRVAWEGHNRYAHRVVYTLLVGPIPDGLTIDHLCRVRACVNPAHMEPVTSRVNTARGMSPSALNAVKTACPSGHAYTPENTYTPPGKTRRRCKACWKKYLSTYQRPKAS